MNVQALPSSREREEKVVDYRGTRNNRRGEGGPKTWRGNQDAEQARTQRGGGVQFGDVKRKVRNIGSAFVRKHWLEEICGGHNSIRSGEGRGKMMLAQQTPRLRNRLVVHGGEK